MISESQDYNIFIIFKYLVILELENDAFQIIIEEESNRTQKKTSP